MNNKFKGVEIGGGMNFGCKLQLVNDFLNSQITNVNSIAILGTPSKVKIFKDGEFKKELSPKNSKIEIYDINGDKVTIMTY